MSNPSHAPQGSFPPPLSPRRHQLFTMIILVVLAACVVTFSPATAAVYSVGAQNGPWQYVIGGLNSAYQFGVNDHLAPTIVSVAAGQQISVSYASGSINVASTGFPPANSYVDALGVVAWPNPNLSPHGNGDTPSVYMGESASSPKYLGELVGSFAGSAGQIIGNPFAIGDGPLVLSVPVGATRLQMGVNDNYFADNVGSWNIDVVEVPEPGSAALICLGTLVPFARRRNAARPARR